MRGILCCCWCLQIYFACTTTAMRDTRRENERKTYVQNVRRPSSTTACGELNKM